MASAKRIRASVRRGFIARQRQQYAIQPALRDRKRIPRRHYIRWRTKGDDANQDPTPKSSPKSNQNRSPNQDRGNKPSATITPLPPSLKEAGIAQSSSDKDISLPESSSTLTKISENTSSATSSKIKTTPRNSPKTDLRKESPALLKDGKSGKTKISGDKKTQNKSKPTILGRGWFFSRKAKDTKTSPSKISPRSPKDEKWASKKAKPSASSTPSSTARKQKAQKAQKGQSAKTNKSSRM